MAYMIGISPGDVYSPSNLLALAPIDDVACTKANGPPLEAEASLLAQHFVQRRGVACRPWYIGFEGGGWVTCVRWCIVRS